MMVPLLLLVCPPALYEKAEIKAPEGVANKHLLIGVSSDRGLCGAVHSNVAKAIKAKIATLTGEGKEVMVVNVGDKLRNILQRYRMIKKYSHISFTLLYDAHSNRSTLVVPFGI